MNPEHIIPLSLGGCDSFTIKVSKAKNSEVNQKVDGKLNNDFLMKARQVQHGFKGHSGAAPVLKVKNAKVDGNPVTWEYSQKEIKAFDHKCKAYLQGKQCVELAAQFNLEIRRKFIAKIALATGYFLFEDIFVNNADHNSLRTFVFADDVKNLKLDLRFYDEFQSPGTLNIPKNPRWETNKLIAARIESSGVLWGYDPDRIVVHVFIGSILLGMVSFKAKIPAFYLDNEVCDDFGTVIRIENNRTITCLPYRSELQEVLKYIDALKSQKGEPPC